MALRKSQLYSSLWNSCDELRGGMDASQYKDYILVLLFVKYVSDKYAGKPDATIVIPAGGGFADMVKLKGDKEIGDKINKIITKLAEENDLKGVIDQADFNDPDKLGSGKEMQDRLSRLVAIFEDVDLRANRAEGDDLLGDAYEYLMRHFATESGKSKGQFYTPSEVSRVIAKVVGVGPQTLPGNTIYDPTCGSGSLLLKAADEAARGVTIYGQEKDLATWALARMNMILHDNPTAELGRNADTLAAPNFKNPDGGLKKFDFAVANPPFSTKSWSHGFDPDHDAFGRFEGFGVPPARNGDYAFLLHLVRSLKSTGKGAIILPHGVLFRGNAEAGIRQNLIKRGLIKGIIALPPNLFYGTGIPACIVVVDKANAAARRAIFMINASAGFLKDGPKNRLRERDIHQIVDAFNNQLDVPGYSRMVSYEEIEKNGFNLNMRRYLDGREPEDLQDLDGHLKGGIPSADIDALAAYWSVWPQLRQKLFADLRPNYVRVVVDTASIKPTIYEHPEFIRFRAAVDEHFNEWRDAAGAKLRALAIGSSSKHVIADLGESLLAHFVGKPLVSHYDLYQSLMDYWAATMQDDCYLIAVDGWKATTYRVVEVRKGKDDKPGKSVDKGWVCDLVPKSLIVAHYFAQEQAAISALVAEVKRITAQVAELEEEHGGEEGLFSELDRMNKASVIARLKAIKGDNESKDETAALNAWLKLSTHEADRASVLKNAEAELDAKALAKYPMLTDAEIKTLVVEEKWLIALDAAIHNELNRISQTLTQRVKELAQRYETPLPLAVSRVAELELAVNHHLQRMGFPTK